MAFTVVYDACVLYPAPLRDLLIRIANAGIVRARWTERILDECFEAILRKEPARSPQGLARTRTLMTEAVPDCMVDGYESLIDGLELPDPDDRHVVAAAIRCGAQVVVTANLDDFPAERLLPYNLEAQHPDDFLVDCIDLAPGRVAQLLADQAAALRNPPQTVEQVLATLLAHGLVQSTARLRELLG
jgi:hypothetical protein